MGKHREGHHQKYLDKGCKLATAHLGRQSHCRECPFPKCLFGKPIRERKHAKRDKAIIADYCAGMDRSALVIKYKIQYRVIARILKAWREGITK